MWEREQETKGVGLGWPYSLNIPSSNLYIIQNGEKFFELSFTNIVLDPTLTFFNRIDKIGCPNPTQLPG